ncbi:hypothetical protein AQUCO_01700321v1 [Aquilegia coerulea]|uniref:Uncharacterized protein n=1 Tax=Aquilegia coerulea TaxID=218851 RepID=A0A2G5DMA6_AQUCA|nr:hypothetical protein AQUCO_01700321v1 [Aquilegia coerulea]
MMMAYITQYYLMLLQIRPLSFYLGEWDSSSFLFLFLFVQSGFLSIISEFSVNLFFLSISVLLTVKFSII